MAGAVTRSPVAGGGGGGCVVLATEAVGGRGGGERRAVVTHLGFTCFAVAVSPVCDLTCRN